MSNDEVDCGLGGVCRYWRALKGFRRHAYSHPLKENGCHSCAKRLPNSLSAVMCGSCVMNRELACSLEIRCSVRPYLNEQQWYHHLQ